jgi:hypothetical protein
MRAAVDLVSLVSSKAPAESFKGRCQQFVARCFLNLFNSTNLLKKKLDTVVSCATVCNHPVSRGSLKLRSANPHDSPIIDLGLLNEQEDMDRLGNSLFLWCADFEC